MYHHPIPSAMTRCFFGLLLALMLTLTGCARTSNIYESDDLVSIVHNNATDYTLLVYENTSGRTRQVLRRKGICELLLIETDEGTYILKERGQEPRKLSASTVAAVQAHLEELVLEGQTAGIVTRQQSTF